MSRTAQWARVLDASIADLDAAAAETPLGACLSDFRAAYRHRATFGYSNQAEPLPPIPAISHSQAQALRAEAFEYYQTSGYWQVDPRELYLATVAAIDASAVSKPGKERGNGNARRYIQERDGSDCWLCGNDLAGDATIEHLHSRALGGSNSLDNLALVHERCNRLLGHMPIAVKRQMRADIQKGAPVPDIRGRDAALMRARGVR